MPTYKINKEQCAGCGACQQICPDGIKMNNDYKAEIIGQSELDKCGGQTVCPMGMIEEI